MLSFRWREVSYIGLELWVWQWQEGSLKAQVSKREVSMLTLVDGDMRQAWPSTDDPLFLYQTSNFPPNVKAQPSCSQHITCLHSCQRENKMEPGILDKHSSFIFNSNHLIFWIQHNLQNIFPMDFEISQFLGLKKSPRRAVERDEDGFEEYLIIYLLHVSAKTSIVY